MAWREGRVSKALATSQAELLLGTAGGKAGCSSLKYAHNWTLDMVLGADNGAPCETSREALEVATWLRALAYNSVSTWRARAPKKDRLPISWERAAETLRDLFVRGLAPDALPPAAPPA